MDKAINVSFASTSFFYLAVGILNYAAMGSHVLGDVIVGYTGSGQSYLALLANVAVLLHMVAAVQVFSSPVFEYIDELLQEHYPSVWADAKKLFLVRLLIRSVYIIVVAACAASANFFSLLSGLIGSLSFFPLQVYFPYLMYNKVFKPTSKVVKGGMWATAAVALVAGILGTIASVYNLYEEEK